LPDFGFTRDGSHAANLATFKGVDNAAFPDIGISDETNRNLLLVGVQLGKLAEKLDKGAFTEGVVRRGVERDRRIPRCQVFDVTGLDIQWLDRIAQMI
jgi:hypothetical protein